MLKTEERQREFCTIFTPINHRVQVYLSFPKGKLGGWSTGQFPTSTPSTISTLSPTLLLFFSLGFLVCPVLLLFRVSVPVMSPSPHLSAGVPSPDLHAARIPASDKPIVSTCLCCSLFITTCSCCIIFAFFAYLFLLLSLSPFCISFSSFTQPDFSRMVPLSKPGPARGFFLFSLPLCLPGNSGSGFLPFFVVKGSVGGLPGCNISHGERAWRSKLMMYMCPLKPQWLELNAWILIRR